MDVRQIYRNRNKNVRRLFCIRTGGSPAPAGGYLHGWVQLRVGVKTDRPDKRRKLDIRLHAE